MRLTRKNVQKRMYNLKSQAKEIHNVYSLISKTKLGSGNLIWCHCPEYNWLCEEYTRLEKSHAIRQRRTNKAS